MSWSLVLVVSVLDVSAWQLAQIRTEKLIMEIVGMERIA